MKRILTGILLALCGLAASAQTTHITASHISYFGGAPVTGQFCLSPTDASGNPINIVTTTGQQFTPATPLCFPIVAGVLSSYAIVPDVSTVQPVNACYALTVKNNANVVVATYPCIQPSTATWSFDAYIPSTLPSIPALTLPQFQLNATPFTNQAVVNFSCSTCTYSAGTLTIPAGSGTSLLSQKVVYTSKLSGVTGGVAVVPGSSATGTVDSATAINAAISGGNVDLEVDSGYALSTSLVLSSNTAIHCIAPQYGFIMQNGSNSNTIVNAHQAAPTTASGTGHGFLVSNVTDQYLTISGCQINSNSTNAVTESTHRYQNSTSTGQALMGIQILGALHVKIIGNTIYDTPTWGVLVSNASDVLIEKNRRLSPTPLVQLKNDDGFDMIGPINNVTLRNNYSKTGDDAFCICADGVQDASNSADATYYPHYHPIPFANGPVTDVLADGLFCDASINCYDLLSTTELIDRVQLNNTNGTVNSIPFRITRYGGLGGSGAGNVGTVRVDNWNVQPTQSGGVYTLSDHFDLDVNASNLAFSHITEDNAVDGYPIFYQRSGTIKNLSINGVEINNTSGTAAPFVLQTAAGTSKPVLSNLTWADNGSGYVFGGAVVPGAITCSGYMGPNRLLNSGYAPAIKNGDCFTNTYPTPSFSIANSQHGSGGASSVATQALPAFSTALTSGSLIIVHQYGSYVAGGTYTVPTDTAGNTYVDCGPGAAAASSGGVLFQCFYALNTHTTASNVVTIHSTVATTYLSGLAFEILGAASSSPIDGGSGAGYSITSNGTGGAAGSNNLSATSLTPANSGDLIVALFTSNSGATAGTSPNAFTLVNSGWVMSAEYFKQATSAAITATASDSVSSDPYGAIVLAIR